MRTSISITNYTCPGGASAMAGYLRDLAQSADETGIDTIWVADHLLQADPAAQLDDPMLEAYTTLGFLASASSRVRLGAMVTPVTFRPPALLLKAVPTLDVLSGPSLARRRCRLRGRRGAGDGLAAAADRRTLRRARRHPRARTSAARGRRLAVPRSPPQPRPSAASPTADGGAAP